MKEEQYDIGKNFKNGAATLIVVRNTNSTGETYKTEMHRKSLVLSRRPDGPSGLILQRGRQSDALRRRTIGKLQGGKIKVVGQYRDDKYEELVLEVRQFADSLISEHVIFLTEGLYEAGSFIL